MEFLYRAKASVLKATSHAAASLRELATPPQGGGSSRTQQQQHFNAEVPRDVLTSLIHSVCGVIDEYAVCEEAESLEGDRALFESNAREYLRKIVDMLVLDGDRWAAARCRGRCRGRRRFRNEFRKVAQDASIAKGDGENDYVSEEGGEVNNDVDVDDETESQDTTIDAFLQSNAMHEFCRRAGRDLPRGTMPMILAFVSSLLKQSRYPFLPHLAVYKPLTKLIAIACRYDSMVIGPAAHDVNYVRRIHTALSNLLHTLWRKVADNPAVLEFFVIEDPRRGAALQPQMDILSALLPQLFKPGRNGETAREALLIALSIRDARIDAFVVQHTRILSSVVMELGRLLNPATADSFVRILRFCNLVIIVSEQERGNVKAALVTLYEQYFFSECLQPLVLGLGVSGGGSGGPFLISLSSPSPSPSASSAVDVASVSNLIRVLLSELSLFRSESPLLRLTVQFLISQFDFCPGLALRASSMFPAVSVASMQLASTLFELAGPDEAHSLLTIAIDADSSLQHSYNSQSSTVSSPIDQVLDSAIKGVETGPPPTAHYVDSAAHDLLGRVSLYFAKSSNGTMEVLSTRSNDSSNFAPPSVERSILCGLVARRLNGFLGLKFDEQVAVAALTLQTASQCCSMVVLIGQGELATTGSMASTYKDTIPAGAFLAVVLDQVKTVSFLHAEVEKLLGGSEAAEDKATAMSQVLMAAATQGHPGAQQMVDSSNVKLLEREPPRVHRMLETAVLLRELRAHLAGFLHATARLRSALAGPEGSFLTLQVDSSYRTKNNFLESEQNSLEDSWEEDLCDNAICTGSTAEGPNLEETERHFLEQMEVFTNLLNK